MAGITLEGFAAEWRSTIAVNLKASTVRAAESHLPAHILPKLGRLLLPKINTRLVQSFVTSLALGELSRKTIENILLTLSSLLRTGKAWEYAAGSKSLSDLSLPHDGVKKEQRCFTAQEVGRIISAASLRLASLRYKTLGASPIEALRQLYRLSRATSW